MLVRGNSVVTTMQQSHIVPIGKSKWVGLCDRSHVELRRSSIA
jgi:hypothetical protein